MEKAAFGWPFLLSFVCFLVTLRNKMILKSKKMRINLHIPIFFCTFVRFFVYMSTYAQVRTRHTNDIGL
jgi:hypothetical protein